MQIQLKGMDDVQKQMERIERATKSIGRHVGVVYSRMPYAWGQHFGHHRVSGKLARKAGPSLYIQDAVNTVLSSADHDLSEGLTKVTAPGKWVLKRLALWVRRLARVNVPRKKGKLRRSIKAKVRAR
jgi:hypothetical protein